MHPPDGSTRDLRWRARSTLGRQLPPPHPRLAAVVIVPVRNEAAGIAATLQSLARQYDHDGLRLARERFEVLLLANNCSDDTAAVARAWSRRSPRLCLHVVEARFYNGHANVGHARRVLMDLACARLRAAGQPDAMIASTDGDTRVAPDWLASLHDEIRAGADAVGGRILNGGPASLPRELARLQRQDTLYQLMRVRLESLLDADPADPWPRHHQHFGANFAVRASAYCAIGGLPGVEHLEDEALFAALRDRDLRLRHSGRARVYTSCAGMAVRPSGFPGSCANGSGCCRADGNRAWKPRPASPRLSPCGACCAARGGTMVRSANPAVSICNPWRARSASAPRR